MVFLACKRSASPWRKHSRLQFTGCDHPADCQESSSRSEVARLTLFRFLALEIVECWPRVPRQRRNVRASSSGCAFDRVGGNAIARSDRQKRRLYHEAKSFSSSISRTHVKLLISLRDNGNLNPAGDDPRDFVGKMKETTGGWKFDCDLNRISSVVLEGRIVKDPKHLGPGWAGFNFKALGKPSASSTTLPCKRSQLSRQADAFLGRAPDWSALVWKQNLLPLELGDLPLPRPPDHRGMARDSRITTAPQTEWKEEVLTQSRN